MNEFFTGTMDNVGLTSITDNPYVPDEQFEKLLRERIVSIQWLRVNNDNQFIIQYK